MAGRLSGKVALISGAARGMGESEARLFAREGAQVVLGDILADQGRSAVENIAQQGGTAAFVPLDALAAHSSGQGRHGRRSRVWRALSCFG